jgi:5'-deoxynucleotidase YfbR-like HD superfamily hydrolase
LVASAKTLKDVRHEIDTLSNAEEETVKKIFQRLKKQAKQLFRNYEEMQNNQKNDLAFLIKSANKIQEKDTKSVQHLTQLLTANKYEDALIGAILQANRSFSLSMRQLNLGVKELMSTEEELKLYQHLTIEKSKFGIN